MSVIPAAISEIALDLDRRVTRFQKSCRHRGCRQRVTIVRIEADDDRGSGIGGAAGWSGQAPGSSGAAAVAAQSGQQVFDPLGVGGEPAGAPAGAILGSAQDAGIEE